MRRLYDCWWRDERLEKDGTSSDDSSDHKGGGSGARHEVRGSDQLECTAGGAHAGALVEGVSSVGTVAETWDGGHDGTTRYGGNGKLCARRRIVT